LSTPTMKRASLHASRYTYNIHDMEHKEEIVCGVSCELTCEVARGSFAGTSRPEICVPSTLGQWCSSWPRSSCALTELRLQVRPCAPVSNLPH
jgi:hypothetical protein